MKPLVTIVTPSFNQGQFIEETILSVLNQSYQNIQYIIIDGGSTDNTMEVVKKYRNSIDIVVHEKDKGQSDAINKGFKLATGDLVGWLNSDDILYPTCIEEIVKLYDDKPDGAIYYVPFQDGINAEGKVHNTAKRIIPGKNYLLNNNYSIIQASSFYKHSVLKKVNYVDESLHYCMDLDLWLKLLNHGPIYHVKTDKALSGFRNWESSKTTTGRDKFHFEILKTIQQYGGKAISRNVAHLYYNIFKYKLKNLIHYYD
ncbi:glycosyltransferase family 2 protein [Pontibacter populi]|uniref:Glycosyltransferase family 2 protein n=1 Tax=Pontibacter populi TaxID=890055 RepID=A0ABV1RXS4_9BACT